MKQNNAISSKQLTAIEETQKCTKSPTCKDKIDKYTASHNQSQRQGIYGPFKANNDRHKLHGKYIK